MTINHRKLEHIEVIRQDPDTDRDSKYFDRIRLIHRALPELDLREIDPSTTFLGKKISFPLIISSMTGGDHDLLKKINKNLAIAAQATQVAMAVGSQRIMFDNPRAQESFTLRPFAPTVPLAGNIGGVQLNYGFTSEHCQKAVDVLEADGLYLHLNSLQEAIQPEGNTDFSALIDKIRVVNEQLNVPILIKEVGCGISPEDIKLLMSAKVKYIDLAGHGGTSWSRIEHHRHTSNLSQGILFQDWGIPTPLAIKMASPYASEVSLIASGGLRNGLDMVKSVILGAQLCGLAAPFLKAAMQSADDVIQSIEHLKHAFTIAMFLLGASNLDYLRGNSQLLLDHAD